MNIRLIGLGEVGHEVVAACRAYFRDMQINALLESQRVVKLSTKAYADTLSGLRNLAEGLIRSPEAFRSLRRALAFLFFGGPDKELAQRWSQLSPRSEPNSVHESARAHHEFLRSLYEKLAKRDLLQSFEQQLLAGFQAHQVEMEAHGQLLGPDWLITPDLPSTEADPKPRHAGIGRELMKRILKSKDNKLERLTGKLGLVESSVDVVAIAFSVGDSFGGAGADELARAIREILQELNHNRIVAVLGLAVYEGDIDVLDGRYIGDYLRVSREANSFDGLIARRSSSGERAKAVQPVKSMEDLLQRVRAVDAYQGFAPILATIAMSSDPRVIQVDNPDANQLQRDFAKSLVSCGYAQVNQADRGASAQPRQIANLYNNAKANLFKHHSVTERFQLLKALAEEAQKLSEQAKGTGWKIPPWIEKLCDPTREPGAIERLTARKVIAYVGYDDHMQGDEIKALREALARDFPRARTVVYKYHVGDLQTWMAKDPMPEPISIPSSPMLAPPPPEPVRQMEPLRYEQGKPVPAGGQQPGGKSSLMSRWLGGTGPQAGGAPGAPMPTAAPLPSASAQAASKQTMTMPAVSQHTSPVPTAAGSLQPHLALFVIDSLETLALERFWEFVLRSVTIREKAGGRLLDRPTDFARAKVIKQRLLARSLLSVPSTEEEWKPSFKSQEPAMLEACPRDTILGCINPEFRRRVQEVIAAVVEGETIRTSNLNEEVQRFYETINTEQMPLIRKARLCRLEPGDLADVLCGLNWLCNEELEKRKVASSLWQHIGQQK